MPGHIEKGRQAEAYVAVILAEKGYRILEKNWRRASKEIDLIAIQGKQLIIVEVKYRAVLGDERYEEMVHLRKQKFLIQAAGAYLACKKLDMEVRFDVVILSGIPGNYTCEHIEDAFSP